MKYMVDAQWPFPVLSFWPFALSFRTPAVYVNVLSAAKNLVSLRINSAKNLVFKTLRDAQDDML